MSAQLTLILKDLLGRCRAKKGMFEGDLSEGELEIGQASAMIKKIMPVSEIIAEIIKKNKKVHNEISSLKI